MIASMDGLSIRGVAAALPAQRLKLEKLAEQFGEREVRRIIGSTGIEEVRLAPPHMNASDLCEAAGRRLLELLNMEPGELDAIVFVSQTPDRMMPATSALLQHRLGLPRHAAAFDISYGCSGFIYGLYQAGMLIKAGGCRRVLVLAGDTTSRLLDPNDRAVRMVFGDAGSACLVEEGASRLAFHVRTDGSGAKHLEVRPGEAFLRMDGVEIMNFALREVPPLIQELLAACGWSDKEIGLWAMHQANRFMLDYLRKTMRVERETFPISVTNVGNTGPASIPLLLSMNQQSWQDNRERLARTVLCGFGVGLSWAAAAADLTDCQMAAPVEIE